MARTDNLTNFLTDVADAIREKKGTEETIKASDFDTEIKNLPSGESSRDWSEIGYSEEPEFIEDGFAYAKEIYDNWIPTKNLQRKFANDNDLLIMPLVDTSITTSMMMMFENCRKLMVISLLNTGNVTTMENMFSGCSILETIPLLDTSSATNMSSMFLNCRNLIDQSLDNILQMCINATSYTGTKTLKTIGITNTTYYPVSRIEALPSYQAFLDAGWTIGY